MTVQPPLGDCVGGVANRKRRGTYCERSVCEARKRHRMRPHAAADLPACHAPPAIERRRLLPKHPQERLQGPAQGLGAARKDRGPRERIGAARKDRGSRARIGGRAQGSGVARKDWGPRARIGGRAQGLGAARKDRGSRARIGGRAQGLGATRTDWGPRARIGGRAHGLGAARKDRGPRARIGGRAQGLGATRKDRGLRARIEGRMHSMSIHGGPRGELHRQHHGRRPVQALHGLNSGWWAGKRIIRGVLVPLSSELQPWGRGDGEVVHRARCWGDGPGTNPRSSNRKAHHLQGPDVPTEVNQRQPEGQPGVTRDLNIGGTVRVTLQDSPWKVA